MSIIYSTHVAHNADNSTPTIRSKPKLEFPKVLGKIKRMSKSVYFNLQDLPFKISQLIKLQQPKLESIVKGFKVTQLGKSNLKINQLAQ